MTKNTLRTIALSLALATGAGGALQAAYAQDASATPSSAPTTQPDQAGAKKMGQRGTDGVKHHRGHYHKGHHQAKRISHHGAFGPMAQSPMLALAHMKSKLSLTDSQQTLWNAAESQRTELGKAMRAQRVEDRKALKAQLDAGPLDLRALSTRQDAQRDALKSRLDAARDAWLVVYDSLDAKQKDTVTQALKARMDRAEHRGKQGGEHPARG